MKLLLGFASALVFATVLPGCSSDSTDGSDLSEDEKTERRERLQQTWVGAWEGQLLPASGASPSFSLDIAYRAPGASPQCGTVDLGAGVDVACYTSYRIGVRGVLTSNDGRFQNTSLEGTAEYGELRLELPGGGFLRIGEGGTGGSYRYGTNESEGTLTARKK